jgi:hypothetical protein
MQDTSSRHTFGPAETQGPLKAVLSVLKTSTNVRAEHNNGILPRQKPDRNRRRSLRALRSGILPKAKTGGILPKGKNLVTRGGAAR